MKTIVSRIGINGEGVSNLDDGKVCFVDGALPDEEVEISIKRQKQNYVICDLNKIYNESPNRVVPKCRYFGVCGGCDIQHMDKHLQQEMKRSNLHDALKKIALLDMSVENVVRVNDWKYRNKMVFPFVYENGESVLGMFVKNSHRVVDIEKCCIASDILNKVLEVSKKYFKSSGFKGFDFKSNKGDIKYLVARHSGENILITIVATRKISLEGYYECLANYFANVGLSIIISDSKSEILSGRYYHIAGLKQLELEEFGIKYQLDNRGFLQVNNELKHELYSRILDNLSDKDNVIDAYSGAGLLSAIMSQKCKRVVGIEINESASNSAKRLKECNNLDNVEFITGDVKIHIKQCLERLDNCVVVLDPPRAGVEESILDILVDNIDKTPKQSEMSNVCKVHKIIYVSCNMATLARDLKVLSKAYNIESITPMDMFPQTKHVETLVVLNNKLSSKASKSLEKTDK